MSGRDLVLNDPKPTVKIGRTRCEPRPLRAFLAAAP